MKKILRQDFFKRPAPTVARDLIGKFLVRSVKGKTVAFMITETEAYHGFTDKASHARYGKTLRTAPMFDTAGVIYVYFTYGMHWMLNIVCDEKEFPSAVLIRGAGDIVGPARLTKAFSIDKRLNRKTLSKKHGLWIEDRGVKVLLRDVEKTPRIGISYAAEWVQKPWRFVYKFDKNK